MMATLWRKFSFEPLVVPQTPKSLATISSAISTLIFQQIEDHPHPQQKWFVWLEGGGGWYAILWGPHATFSAEIP